MDTNARFPVAGAAERGSSLFVVLAMVAAAAMIMLTAFYAARSQGAIVGNLQYQEQAFARAEAVVAAAQAWLDTGSNPLSSAFNTYSQAATPGLYPPGQLAALNRNPRTMTWSDSNSVATTDGRYLIQLWARDQPLAGNSLQDQQAVNDCRRVNVFQLIGRSEPVRGATRLVEVMYVKPAC